MPRAFYKKGVSSKLVVDWEKLKVFYNVAESGSFTQAATRLRVDPSAISRQIGALEDRLGMPLFSRHARGITLTEHGILLFQTARTIFADLAMVEAQIIETSQTSHKILKIAATIGFGTGWILPRLPTFLARYPEIRPILHVGDSPVDLSLHESDVSITTDLIESDDIISHPLFDCPLPLYASSSYLLEFGVPLTLAELDHHRLIVFSDKTMIPSDNINWLLICGTASESPRTPYLSINNLYGIAHAVEAGSGIACLPPYIAKTCKNLVQILPEVSVPSVHFYFSYARQLKDSKKIQNLWHFLKQEACSTR